MTSTITPLDTQSVLASIREIGHWRVRLIPESADQRFKLRSDCADVVARNAIQLRGGPYPYVPVRGRVNDWQAPVEDGWEALVDRDWQREVWRLTRSGQFVHYRALQEDIAYRSPPASDRRSPWFISGRDGWQRLANPREGKWAAERVLFVESSVHTLYEIVEFSRRLTTSADYGAAIELEIDLADSRGRRLEADWGLPPPQSFTAVVDCVNLRRTIELTELASDARAVARDLAVELFDMFEFSISDRIVDGMVSKLLERR